MKIYIGADHTGFELKEKIRTYLSELGHEVEDCGAFEYDKSDDYPDFIAKTAQSVSKDLENSLGIVIGGSGQGEAMAANKIKGIRCALFYGPALAVEAIDINGNSSDDPYEILKLTRIHNGANVLSLGVRFLTEAQAKEAVKVWLDAPFATEDRHIKRIEKIKKIEEKS
ncbi:hypothetical protein A2858_02295 [Candidatus Daviesbacteria bacterium RIFCSPHIGHO2_01_FULL_36_37]|nr:MAG: hypothetical protein A2858_02295 [Candidatus Daviesbacteria bacterium RIFCSPHIGHO2_01_FULL_36_37]OGE33382.1 MAG: hypothetical protein A3C99_01685 [Candidatus Daviesbacteria bacterium RIFCSPHIGHO2_02_FULL_37_9]OGE34727.1 MAG: hypothetical protein A3E66_03815 [Candidatus Daviesbacteria bacterium RIFCSPHIGHO2_12_FULL_37_16]